MIPATSLDILLDVAEAARALHERVEMDESVGVCLSDRVPSLNLGRALGRLDFPEEEQVDGTVEDEKHAQVEELSAKLAEMLAGAEEEKEEPPSPTGHDQEAALPSEDSKEDPDQLTVYDMLVPDPEEME